MIAIISKDAGGAELVSRFALNLKDKYCFALSGPAIKIFKKKFNKIKIISKSQAIKKSDWVLCSTGIFSDFEKDGIILAKKNRKKVIAVIDHWIDYKSRFLKKKKLFLPNEIWVTDDYALKIIKKEKFKTKILLKKNPYFEEFKEKIKLFNKKKKVQAKSKNIIFISEWLSLRQKKNYSIKECLIFFLDNLHSLKVKINKISIRFHPAENIRKLKWVKKYHNKIIISNKRHIFDDILKHDIVVGVNSSALIFGLIAKKKVISCVPTKKTKCELPHKKIIDLKKII